MTVTYHKPSEPELQTLEPRTAIGKALRVAARDALGLGEPSLGDLADLEVRVLAQLGLVRWELSKRGNLWVKLPNATLMVFRDKKAPGWRGCCITRSAKEGPIFGELLHDDAESAKSELLLKYISLGGTLC